MSPSIRRLRPAGMVRVWCAVAVLAALASAGGCRRKDLPEPEPMPPVPEIARGTIGSYVRFTSLRAESVAGYGVVIGLNGTGSKDMPANLRRKLMREMYRAGLDDAQKILDSPNTAAVLVSGMVMPFHSRGSRFDVQVSALEGTQTTSLEGGTLVRTTLAPLIRDLDDRMVLGAPVAVAHGPVLVRAAARSEREAQLLDLKKGIIVGGGRFSGDREIIMELIDPNLRMCLLIEQTINARFPRCAKAKSRQLYTAEAFRPEPGEEWPDPKSSLEVEPPPKETQYYLSLKAPPEYAGRWTHFMQVIASTPLDRREAAVNQRIRLLIDKLRDDEERVTACYGLEAIGNASIPPLVALLNDPQRAVRVAAASVLIALGDARGTDVLIQTARDPESAERLAAIYALGRTIEPKAAQTLQELTGNIDLETRFAAYESLRSMPHQSVVENVDQAHGVRQFGIDLVHCDGPALIVAQAVGDPRLVFFGDAIRFKTPIFFDEGRYWAIADTGAETLTIMPPKPEPRRPLIQNELHIQLNVLDYVILMDRLGASYPEVLDRLTNADRLGQMTAGFELRRAPASAPIERRLE